MKQLKIKSIKKLEGTHKVYDIEVPLASHYILENKVVTHNSGGGGLKFAASTIIYLSKTKLYDVTKKKVLGSILTAVAEKSRFTRFGKKVQLLLAHEYGLNRYYGMFDFGKETELLKMEGKSYTFPDGQVATHKEIENNPAKFFETETNFAAFEEMAGKTFKFGKGEIIPIDPIDLPEDEQEFEIDQNEEENE